MKRVAAIVALGAALVLAAIGCGENSSAPGHGILFVARAKYGKSRIFLWNPGSPAKPLGPAAHGISAPQWSPDGRSIAWEDAYIPARGQTTESDEISVMRSDGTRIKALAADDYYDGPPSWSPDGRRLVYVRAGIAGGGGLVIVDVPSGHEHRLHPAGLCFPEYPCKAAWGKSGIAYPTDSGIMLLNPATGRSRLIASGHVGVANHLMLAWSAGGVLAAVEPTRILLLVASGRVLGTLPVSPAARQPYWDVLGSVCGIAWSPTGVLAAVEPTQIVLAKASGRVLGTLPIPPEMRPVCAIAWSPDGKQIVAPTVKANGPLWVGTVQTKHWERLPGPIGSTWSDSASWR